MGWLVFSTSFYVNSVILKYYIEARGVPKTPGVIVLGFYVKVLQFRGKFKIDMVMCSLKIYWDHKF